MSSINQHLEFVDLEDLEVEDQRKKTRERWLATYSTTALKQGVIVSTTIVKHQRFEQMIGCLDRMFLLSRELQQPVGGVISGLAGVGKSTLCEYFLNTLPKHDLAGGNSGVIYIRLRRNRPLASAVQQILQQLQYPLFKTTGNTIDAKRGLSIEALQRNKIRLILVDEGHRMISIRAERRNEEPAISEYFQELMDEAKLAVCLVGGPNLSALKQSNPYLESRCVVNETIHEFQQDHDWLSLAHTLLPKNNALNLKSLQSSQEGRKALFETAHGNLRRLKQFLTELTMVVVDKGVATTDSASLQLAFQRTFGSENLPNSPWR